MGAELWDEDARIHAGCDALALRSEPYDALLLPAEQAEVLADNCEPPAHYGRQAEQWPMCRRVAELFGACLDPGVEPLGRPHHDGMLRNPLLRGGYLPFHEGTMDPNSSS
jgi:hypothetical protein